MVCNTSNSWHADAPMLAAPNGCWQMGGGPAIAEYCCSTYQQPGCTNMIVVLPCLADFYVCIYIYIYIYLYFLYYIYIYIYIYVSMYICICIYMYALHRFSYANAISAPAPASTCIATYYRCICIPVSGSISRTMGLKQEQYRCFFGPSVR